MRPPSGGPVRRNGAGASRKTSDSAARVVPYGFMPTVAQRALLLLYRAATRSGVLRLPGMDHVFDGAYELYKRFLEASYIALLQSHVEPGTIVVDVGANVGFFTRYFARWTGPEGRVLAIEPEARNFERLVSTLRARRLGDIVEPVNAAAAEHSGQVALTVDPYHPAGHYLSAQGVPTRAVTVDELVRAHGGRRVSLIKIDVQGAELRVLHGAAWTLDTFRPALLVELDHDALRAQGASVHDVVDFLLSRGYQGRLVDARGLGAVCDREALLGASLRAEYVDALFTAAPAGR
jgi:FkbM family methyltransferase